MHGGETIAFSGLTRTSYTNIADGGDLMCVRTDLKGYGVILSRVAHAAWPISRLRADRHLNATHAPRTAAPLSAYT
jgi:hypothetical protein